MGLEVAAIASIVGAATAVVGLAQGISSRNENRRAQERIQNEQRAANAASAAKERRQQIREERIRRARILQAGENTGTGESSGELGSLGSLSTNLSSNIGFNLGAIQRGQNISIFSQQASNAQSDAMFGDQLFNLGTSIFQASGGFSTRSNNQFQGGSFPINNVVGTPQAGG